MSGYSFKTKMICQALNSVTLEQQRHRAAFLLFIWGKLFGYLDIEA